MSEYTFFYPTENDSMADVKKNLTDNLKVMETRNDPTIIPAGNDLPQSGNYELGDRVYRDDPVNTLNSQYPSNYLLVTKDVNWGWYWRPIHTLISPWFTVPGTAIQDANFQQNTNAPLQIAMDCKGYCHWRGSLQKTSAGIAANTNFNILKTLPQGLKPNTNFTHTIALSPVASAAGKPGNVSGRVILFKNGTSSFRFSNSTGVSQTFWLDGFSYNNADEYYYGP